MDATEPGSTAFTFLHALDLPCQGRGWYAIRGIGRDLGLADNETREVIRHLAAHRLLAWRSGEKTSELSGKTCGEIQRWLSGKIHPARSGK